MKNLIFTTYSIIICCVLFHSCKIEGIEDDNIPKENFNSKNYILATEDATTSDITRFFAFDLEKVRKNSKSYDLLNENELFINSDPSTSSGIHSIGRYIFSMAKDKKGYSSTPGVYRLTLNRDNHLFIDNSLYLNKISLFLPKKLCLVNDSLGFFYNESAFAQSISIFNPKLMVVTGIINLKPIIEKFHPNIKWTDENKNNLVRTGTLAIEEKEGKLYVSVVFLEKEFLNIIPDEETSFHLIVIDIKTSKPEKGISYPNTRTVGFYVSENNPTSKDEHNNLYFCSWGWNQFGSSTPSKIFRIKSGETDFDKKWEFNIETHFGKDRIAQSMISYNNKIYLHISNLPYQFETSDSPDAKLELEYYELNPTDMSIKKLEIPGSDPSPRMNVFNLIDNKLYICVPNSDPKRFNGLYSIDRNGNLCKELTIKNKYKPTRLYKLSK